MAGIQEIIEDIKSKIYGKDVRQAIADGLSYINNVYTNFIDGVTPTINTTEVEEGTRVDFSIGEVSKSFTVKNGTASDEQVSAWLDAHPEATTTVQDSSLTEAKFTDDLKLKTVKDYVNPKMFGAKGDGSTDDTGAIQNCLSSMTDGSMFYLPKGTYVITQVTCNILTKARYVFDGVFKLKDGETTPYGMFIANGTNCIFDGLKIDGNVNESVDELQYGVS